MAGEQTQYVALRERVKELTCLYSLAQLAQRPEATLEQILQGAADLLAPAWQYPEVAAARVILDGRAHPTTNFKECPQMQSAAIVVNGRHRGRIDVVYTEEKPALDEGPFLKEERDLIDGVAKHLAVVIERRQAEEERSGLQEQLRHADRLATIGQLAAGVAHELNEPLGNILGFAQLAQKQPGLPEPVARDLGKIVATCLHARQIIGNLMLFSRQTPPRKAQVNLNAVVEEGLCLLAPRCDRDGITVVRRLSPDLPAITADVSQLRQVLVNLVVNAIHAMPDGGTLQVGTRTSGNRIVLTVQDSGIGMSQQVLKEIFIPFFTTKDVNEGTGLGLPVVHGIVTSHGGAIRVDSAPGQGACFEIDLPLAARAGKPEDRTNDIPK